MKKRFFLISSMICFLFFLSSPLGTLNAENPAPATVSEMLGESPPVGTIATSDSEYDGRPATRVFDGDLSTEWTGTANKGYVQLVFPEPRTLDFVQVVSGSVKKSITTIKIEGLHNGSWKSISTPYVMTVPLAQTISDPIKVEHGKYDGIRISITMDASWVGITEVTIGTYQDLNLSALPGDKQATLSWNKVDSADGYTIYYGLEPNTYTESIKVTADVYKNYLVPGLMNGKMYYFMVTANLGSTELTKSNEAVATPNAANPTPEPEEPENSNRAILVITMVNGLEKEYDLTMKEVNKFLNWYDNKDLGSGPSRYEINKNRNNIGPFIKQVDSVIFNNILTFEINSYLNSN